MSTSHHFPKVPMFFLDVSWAQEGMEIHLRSLPGSRVRLLAWAASEAGTQLPDLLGEAPGKVDPELAQHVWATCSQLAGKGQLWQGWPLPVVEVAQVLMKDLGLQTWGCGDDN